MSLIVIFKSFNETAIKNKQLDFFGRTKLYSRQ